MARYTFNKKEKVLMTILALLLVGVAWYFLVFSPCQQSTQRIETQVSSTQTQVDLAASKLQSMDSMQSSIDADKQSGKTQVTMPAYDNSQAALVQLNGALADTESYTLSFNDLDWSTSGVVKRGIDVVYGCSSYATARQVLDKLTSGTYPCTIDSVTISNSSAGSKVSTSSSGTRSVSSSATSVRVHVTFYETC